MKKSAKEQDGNATIARNKKAFHDYFIEQRFEAGLVLQGWEVKSLRSGRVQVTEGYVILKEGEVFLIGATITPLPTVSTHFEPDPQRTRKCLLRADEIRKLIGQVERKGYTLVPLSLYWKHGLVKLEIGLACGKKQYDKRTAIKERDWARSKERLLRSTKK